MHECYFASEQAEWALRTGHSWSGRVAEIISKSDPGQVLLTHVNPLDENPGRMLQEVVEKVGSSELTIELASDGMALEFGR